MQVGTTGAFYDKTDSKAQAAYVKEIFPDGKVLLVLFESGQTVQVTPSPVPGNRVFVSANVESE